MLGAQSWRQLCRWFLSKVKCRCWFSAWSVPLHASLIRIAKSLSLAFALPNFGHLTGVEFKAVDLVSVPVNRERQVPWEQLHFCPLSLLKTTGAHHFPLIGSVHFRLFKHGELMSPSPIPRGWILSLFVEEMAFFFFFSCLVGCFNSWSVC